jgi:MoxR-like ATPase
VADSLDMPLFEWSATQGLVRRQRDNQIHGTIRPMKLLQHVAALDLEGLFLLKDFARHLNNPVIIRLFREIAQAFSGTRSTVILTGDRVDLPGDLSHRAVHCKLDFAGPDELKKTVAAVVRSVGKWRPVQTVLRRSELEELLLALRGLTLHQVRQVIAQAVIDDGKLSVEDVRLVLDRKVQVIRDGGLLEYYPVEDNRFQLGGFARLKEWLRRARVGLSDRARELNLSPPKGILLVGVQGCGKSLAAKVIARQWRFPLLKLDAGRLMDKFIGQSEKNLREAIALAESMAPAVLWVDEIEKGLAASRSGDVDGGVGLRLLGTFLTWLQEKKKEVFVAATANDLARLPPELLRKGRFDEIFFVDLPVAEEREEIFRIHLQLRKQKPEDFRLPELVAATDGFSGAEIEQAVIGALYRSLYDNRPLDTEILLEEIRSTVPLSVSRREDIEALRQDARDRFVSVR